LGLVWLDFKRRGKMKKVILSVAVILLTAMPVMAVDGMIDVESAYSVKETADRLESILNQKGMTVFNRINHSDAAGKAGFPLRETALIIFGNPKVGSPLMKCRQSVAIDLPQKALVHEDAGGKVWISYNDPAYLKQRHDISGCDAVLLKVGKALAGISTAAASK